LENSIQKDVAKGRNVGRECECANALLIKMSGVAKRLRNGKEGAFRWKFANEWCG